MKAILSLSPFKIASDTGNLICTEVLQYGVYPRIEDGRIISWGFLIAGEQLSLTLYNEAIKSCEKYTGTNPRISDPPQNVSKVCASSVGSVKFEREEKVNTREHMKSLGIELTGEGSYPTQFAIKRYYSAPSKKAALDYLKANPVDKPLYYLVITTPQGVFGRDIDGFFNQ